VGIVLSGGGARGAYEAGVLSYLFEHVYPRLEPGFEFHVLSGTSVGAIHAAYLAATGDMEPRPRSQRLLDTWCDMKVGDVLQLSFSDLVGLPLRALGVRGLARRLRSGADVIGGLVDIAPLERIVSERIPWDRLRPNLDGARPKALCVSCTQVRSGRVTVFMDGRLADPTPWEHDPNAHALVHEITARHVRASAAIPFLFPAVLIDDRYYVDGGLRMNTPLSPALRLGCDRILVVGLRHSSVPSADHPPYAEDVITQPAFLMGKVLNALMLDQLEYEMQRLELVNALIEQGDEVYGADFLEKINVAVRRKRGVDYRHVRAHTIRPSHDIGATAAECYQRQDAVGSMGILPALLTRVALRGVPTDEADLLSYLYFDRCFTKALVDLGREDARREEDAILDLLGS